MTDTVVQPNDRIRVLLVEDDVVDVKAMMRHVGAECLPLDVTIAQSLEEGRRCLSEATFDVALVDRELGDGLGTDLLGQSDVPVVVVAGAESQDTSAQALAAGAYGFLVKDQGRRYLELVYATVQNAVLRRRAELREREYLAQLERSNEDLEAFAAAISHDLKSPVRQVHVLANILREDLGPGISGPVEDSLSRIERTTERMRSLVDGLLAYSKVQGGEDRGVLELRPVLDSVLEDLGEEVRAADAKVEISGSMPAVFANRTRMRQLFQNLLSNAVKYRGERPVEVNVTAAALGDDLVQISVQDNGIGVPADCRERVFDVFLRLNPGSDVPGAGVGLALCRRIVESNGGRVWVEDSPGGGATFHCTLRAAGVAASV